MLRSTAAVPLTLRLQPDERRVLDAIIAWVTTAYLLASTVTTPLWGKLGDLFGRKFLFQGAIVLGWRWFR